MVGYLLNSFALKVINLVFNYILNSLKYSMFFSKMY